MFNYVRLSDGGIDRLDNVRPEVHVLCDIALRLFDGVGVDFEAFKTHRHIREAIAAIVPGMEALASIDVAKREFHVGGRLLHTPDFKTVDGLARFRVHAVPEMPAVPSGRPSPFLLSTVRSEGQFNTIVYEYRDSYRQTDERWVVMMNPDDARERSLEDGDTVNLVSAQGRMADVRVHAYDLPRGNLMAYFPEANVLISTAVDPQSRTPAFKSTPVWIE
jgi:anaerobic selenocysteine-containing dehydrogenase